MKETKPFLLVLVSVFLLISLGLLTITIYLYIKKPAELITASKNKNGSSATLLGNTRDSLEKKYSAAINDADTSFYPVLPLSQVNTLNTPNHLPDSLNSNKGNTIAAFEKLRNEINSILQDKSPNADLALAKIKIDELQVLVDILKNKNTEISKENERLYALLKQLANEGKPADYPAKKTGNETFTIPKDKTGASFKVDNIQLSAITTNDFIEKETSSATETEKLVGSFSVKNGGGHNVVAELMVVVLQPDGKVLQNSNWETGIFYTKEGKQIYSNKLRFDNNGEPKQLNFSLQAEKYLPGKYTVEVYHNGTMIGRTTKTLS